MIKIVLIGNDERNYAVVKRIISELDFLYKNELSFIHFSSVNKNLKDEISKNDYKKIYLINIDFTNKNARYDLVKYIRQNDWYSEIILLRNNDAILDCEWQNIHNIFDIIEVNKNYDNLIKDDLRLILGHNCYGHSFNYKNRDINLNIYFEKILYIYRDTGQRKVVVVTDNNLYTLNTDLKSTMKLLDERFKQVHRACVVNAMRTEKFDWSNNSFTLDNGDEINMLSKHYRNNVSDFLNF